MNNYQELIEAARIARNNAVAPISKHMVGAALLAKSGRIYVGANVEPGVMNLGICAERVALFSALAQGERSFEAIAVYGGIPVPCYPCGACRQVFSDLIPDIIWILVGDEEVKIECMSDILPHRIPRQWTAEAHTTGRGVIDRFENDGSLVVVETEDKQTLILDRSVFIGDVHVNDVVCEIEPGVWTVDKDATTERLRKIDRLIDELWEK